MTEQAGWHTLPVEIRTKIFHDAIAPLARSGSRSKSALIKYCEVNSDAAIATQRLLFTYTVIRTREELAQLTRTISNPTVTANLASNIKGLELGWDGDWSQEDSNCLAAFMALAPRLTSLTRLNLVYSHFNTGLWVGVSAQAGAFACLKSLVLYPVKHELENVNADQTEDFDPWWRRPNMSSELSHFSSVESVFVFTPTYMVYPPLATLATHQMTEFFTQQLSATALRYIGVFCADDEGARVWDDSDLDEDEDEGKYPRDSDWTTGVPYHIIRQDDHWMCKPLVPIVICSSHDEFKLMHLFCLIYFQRYNSDFPIDVYLDYPVKSYYEKLESDFHLDYSDCSDDSHLD